MLQYIRSVVFLVSTYLAMLVLGLVFAPFAVFSRNAAFFACKSFCRYVRWSAVWMVGIRTEVRGPVPEGEVMVAAKHQSFLDIILIFQTGPRAKFIMKNDRHHIAPIPKGGETPVSYPCRIQALRR